MKIFKSAVLWIAVILFLVLLVVPFVQKRYSRPKKISFDEFMEFVKSGSVQKVLIEGERIQGEFKDASKGKFETFKPDYPELTKLLIEKGVRIEVLPHEDSSAVKTALISWIPILFLIFIWFSFLKNVQSSSLRAFSFTKSRAKLMSNLSKKITFKDVGGCEEAIEEVKEIVEFLKSPEKFSKIGARVPKGILLVGPPGSGKTLLAKAIASEANVPFYSASGSEFVELFVGVGAGRIRDMFEEARKNSPAIIFIDEIDAVGRIRGSGLGGGHDEREQTLNQLLIELDGIQENQGIVVIAATNRPDILDPALLRPGRLDRRVYIPHPDRKGREEILRIHTRKLNLSKDVDLNNISKVTPGFSGADLENLVNEAAILAARKNKEEVGMEEFEEAKDKVLMGLKKPIVMSEEERRRIAYHEAGHAILAATLKHADPIHKVTIMPRGPSLGLTQQLPDDRYILTKSFIEDNLTVLLGGRAAEELIFKELSTGSSNDLQRATEIALKVVCEWGMSSLGPRSYKIREEYIFLGKELARRQELSEEASSKIDEEVNKIINDASERAKNILKEKIESLHKVAKELLEKETLTGEDIKEILS